MRLSLNTYSLVEKETEKEGKQMAEQTSSEKLKARIKATKKAKEPSVIAVVSLATEVQEKLSTPATKESIIKVKPQRKVLLFPDKKLLTMCKPIEEVTPWVLELAREMQEFLLHPPESGLTPIGLAAPQYGECVRMFSCMLNPRAGAGVETQIITLINPELIYEKKIKRVTETCLSLPRKTFDLKRGKIVKIRATLLDGTPRTFKGHELIAQMFLHEINHLDGVLINTLGQLNR